LNANETAQLERVLAPKSPQIVRQEAEKAWQDCEKSLQEVPKEKDPKKVRIDVTSKQRALQRRRAAKRKRAEEEEDEDEEDNDEDDEEEAEEDETFEREKRLRKRPKTEAGDQKDLLRAMEQRIKLLEERQGTLIMSLEANEASFNFLSGAQMNASFAKIFEAIEHTRAPPPPSAAPPTQSSQQPTYVPLIMPVQNPTGAIGGGAPLQTSGPMLPYPLQWPLQLPQASQQQAPMSAAGFTPSFFGNLSR
jgi:hypothetical protein